jgi:NADPH:quinone reductase-like Zn-dependent oxidoreductase
MQTTPDWPTEIRKITNKHGVDLVVEHVGGAVLLKCFDCLARGGDDCNLRSDGGREVPLNLWPLFVKQQRLVGSYGRDRADLQTTLEWAAAGKLKPSLIPFFRWTESRSFREAPLREPCWAKC